MQLNSPRDLFQYELSAMYDAEQKIALVLGSATKIEHYEIAAYRGLANKALMMGETQCAQILEINLAQEEETAGKLERLSHEMSQQTLAAT